MNKQFTNNLNKSQTCPLGVFIFRVTIGTEMQGRQKVAKFCKIFKNDLKKKFKLFFGVRQWIEISSFSFFSQKL